MSTLKINILKEIINNLPEDYTVEYKNKDNILTPITDTVEIDVSNKKLILKSD